MIGPRWMQEWRARRRVAALRRRARRAVARMAWRRLAPDHPWLDEFANPLGEAFLVENAAHHRPFVELVEELAALGAGGRVPRLLEAGAGSGAFSIHFSRRCHDVVAVDYDPLMVLRARHLSDHLGGHARVVCMDLRDLGWLRPDAFDVAFSQGTLEHLDNGTIRQVLAAQLAVAPHVVFSVPSVHWPSRDFVNERKMSLEEWKTILSGVDAELLHLGAYQRDRHVLVALRRRQA